MKKVLGVGNALVDILYNVDNPSIFSELGISPNGMTLINAAQRKNIEEKFSTLPFERRTGGSASNAVHCLAALGGEASFIGRTGTDAHASFYAEACQQAGVHPLLSHSTELPTGVASTFILPNGDRTFATYLGASATLSADDIEESAFDKADYLFIEGYLVQNHALITKAVDIAHRHGLKVCLDLASWNIVKAEHDFFDQLLPKVDIVFANEEEAQAMTERSGVEAALWLAKTCPLAIVKRGAEGAVAAQGESIVQIKANPVEHVTDTTGAGDFFAGGFLFKHAQDAPLTACLEMGAHCAAEVIQVMGTQLSEKVWEKLRQL